MKELISVIVPVYNGDRFISKTIDSVITQSYKNIEIIVVDDGSTDKSVDIVKSYKNIQYIYQDNKGPSSARNTGISSSKGTYIAFLDCDDVWYNEKLSMQEEFLRNNPKIGFVFAHRKMIIEEGIPKPPWYREHLFEKPSPILTASALLARRSAFEAVGGYNTDFRFGENAEWLSRAKHIGIKMEILKEVLLDQRLHDENQTYHLDEMRSNILKVLKNSIDRKKGLGPENG